MAVIGTIRKQSGLLIIIIGVALAAFVLGDFLKPSNSRIENNIAEVLGEDINYSYFDSKYETNLELQKRNQQKENLTSEEIFRLKQQTYDQIVQSIVLQNEYNELGLMVSQEELAEQIHGENPHAYINQVYSTLTNVMGKPEGSAYDPATVIEFMNTIKDRPSNDPYKDWWDKLVIEIKDNHLQNKYKNLITKAYFMPDTFLVNDFDSKKTNAKIRLVGQRHTTIADSLVTVTDEVLRNYYNDYKQNYKKEASRDIEYVVFEVKPSAKDRKDIRDDVFAIFEDFKTSENIPLFVNSESDKRYDSTFFKAGELPIQIDSVVFNSEVGSFVEPYLQDNAWHMSKLMDFQSRPDSMKASHILIMYSGSFNAGENITRNKDEAKKLADSLLAVVKADKSKFENLATGLSDDPSVAENNGDLGWFADGAMVYPFNQAVLTGKVGEITRAESQFGYHIINITDKLAAVNKVRVAIIDIEVTPSQETFQDLYGKASGFQGNALTQEAFDTLTTKEGLSKRSATVQAMSNRIAGIEYPRPIIQWSFIDGIKVGSVSHVFTMEDKYVVAIVTKATEEGIPEMEDIREQIEPLVKTDLKLDKLLENIKNALGETNDLGQLAVKLNSKVDTVTNLNFELRNIAGFGNEPNLIAKAFSADPGVVTGPVKGNNAAFVFILDEITPPNATEDNKMYKRQLLMNFQSKVNNNGFLEALKDNADIKDNRVTFY